MNFAILKNLVVKSTKFPDHNIHKCTWISSDNTCMSHNQINHLLVDNRRQSNIIDVHSLIGANCDTDLYLVVATVQARLTFQKRTKLNLVTDRYKLNKLLMIKKERNIIF